MTPIKKPRQLPETGDIRKDTAMILKLDPVKHAWIKQIAESTGMTQPNVVNLVLSKAISEPSADYIGEIKRANAAEQMKQLEERQKALDLEKQRLKEMLED